MVDFINFTCVATTFHPSSPHNVLCCVVLCCVVLCCVVLCCVVLCCAVYFSVVLCGVLLCNLVCGVTQYLVVYRTVVPYTAMWGN